MSTKVTDRFEETKERFSQLFYVYESNLNGAKKLPFHAIRQKAIGRLPELNFPTRKNEDWKYTSVAKILQPSYNIGKNSGQLADQIGNLAIEGLDCTRIVFVNCVLDEASSQLDELPNGQTIEKLSHAFAKDEVKKRLEYLSSDTENPFVALNTAFAKSGLYIHVAKNTRIEKPVHLQHLITDSDSPVLVNPQILVHAESSSEFSMIETYQGIGEGETDVFTNVVNTIDLEANAKVKHYRVQNLGLSNYLVNHTTAYQQRDSIYSSYSVDLGGKIVRNNIYTILKDQSTHTDLYGVYLGNQDQHIDNQTFIDHAFPHCTSNELYKGVLTDKARGVFNGKVIVRQDAQKTNAFQQNSSLVLSEQAVMDSKPQLEIYADDVRCSHGATIGQLEPESIYYLRSRGISLQEAQSLLQVAFLREVTEEIDIEPLANYIDALIDRKFAE